MHPTQYDLDLEIGELWYAPFWRNQKFWLIVVLTVSLMVVGALLFKFFLKKKVVQNIVPNPYETFLKWLEEQDRMIDQVVDVRHFYLMLIAGIKRLLSDYLKCDVSAQTDLELRFTLKQSGMPPEFVEVLIEQLNDSYMIRFGGGRANCEKMHLDLQKIKRLTQSLQTNRLSTNP